MYFLINFIGVISCDKRRSVSRQYGGKCSEKKKQKIERCRIKERSKRIRMRGFKYRDGEEERKFKKEETMKQV